MCNLPSQRNIFWRYLAVRYSVPVLFRYFFLSSCSNSFSIIFLFRFFLSPSITAFLDSFPLNILLNYLACWSSAERHQCRQTNTIGAVIVSYFLFGFLVLSYFLNRLITFVSFSFSSLPNHELAPQGRNHPAGLISQTRNSTPTARCFWFPCFHPECGKCNVFQNAGTPSTLKIRKSKLHVTLMAYYFDFHISAKWFIECSSFCYCINKWRFSSAVVNVNSTELWGQRIVLCIS